MRLVASSSFQPFRRTLVGFLRASLHSRCRQLGRDQSGATAIEFALIAGILVYLLLNGIDLGRYIYLRGQVENATQAGAHSVWEKCDPMKLPIVTKCYANQTAAKTAVVSVISSIVEGVVNDHVTITESYYCTDAAGALHSVTNVASLPAQCLPGTVPGDYVQVQLTYPFTPLFGNLTVAGTFGTTISMISYMRLQ
jgi:Flp pilus assembly pilin Flp